MKNVPMALALLVLLPYLAAAQSATVTCDANADTRALIRLRSSLEATLRTRKPVRFTHVYVLREGRWRPVSSQITPMLK